MSWKMFYFGEQNPSLKRQASIHLIMLVILSSPYPFWGDFAPKDTIFKTCGLISILTMILSIGYIWKVRERFSQNYLFMQQSLKKRIFGICLLPLMALFFTGAFTMYTVPAMLTVAVGHEVNIRAAFKKKDSSSRKSCNYRIYSEMFNNLIPSYMCLTKTQYLQETNEFIITSKVSIFGTLYKSVE